jgi:tellurite resistance protein TerC
MVWLNEAFGGKFPVTWSLGIIGALLTASVAVSLALPPRATAVIIPRSTG